MIKAATMTLLALALATMLGFPIWIVEREEPPTPAASKAEARFAVRYCYKQYRNQTDAVACLARLVH